MSTPLPPRGTFEGAFRNSDGPAPVQGVEEEKAGCRVPPPPAPEGAQPPAEKGGPPPPPGPPPTVRRVRISVPGEEAASDFHQWAREVVHQGGDGRANVNFGGRRLDDERFASWCVWAKTNFKQFVLRKPTSLNFDISENQIGDSGCVAMVELLEDLQIPVLALKLYNNRIGDQGAARLAEYLQHWPVHEVHLSHNALGLQGARALVKSMAIAVDRAGEPLYPIRDGPQRPKPVWLRMEYNFIEVEVNGGIPQSIFKHLEDEARHARENRGLLESGQHSVPLLCDVPRGCCNSKTCGMLVNGARGRPLGPIVQVPWIYRQKRPTHGGGAPPGKISYIPSPCRKVPQVVPPRCRDIRLDNPSTSSSLQKHSVGRLTAGQRARVTRAVEIPKDYAAENFLVNLRQNAEVEVVYIGTAEAEDEGWCWASTLDGAEGWLQAGVLEGLPPRATPPPPAPTGPPAAIDLLS